MYRVRRAVRVLFNRPAIEAYGKRIVIRKVQRGTRLEDCFFEFYEEHQALYYDG